MRICSPQLGISPKSILGGEVFDREILLGLAKRGVKVEVILPKNKPHDKKVKNWSISYLPISRFPAFLGNFLIIPNLFKIYKRTEFEILRIHQPQYLGLGCLLFKIFHPEVKLVATYHQFRETKFTLFSEKINILWDHIICDSHHVKHKLVQTYQIEPSKITVVHNGAPSYLKPTVKDKKLVKQFKLENKTVLLFMGLFVDRKNPFFLIDVLSNLSRTKPDIVLILWGEGPLKSQIVQKAKKLKVEDKIRIVDPIFGSEKNKMHNLADIFVHPSVDEGFALAPLEAMACAKPVVMTGGYSAQEAVGNGINGFLCHSNDLDQWSNKISKLAGDPKLRIRMGKSSLIKVKKEFQWQLAVNTHHRVFQNLI